MHVRNASGSDRIMHSGFVCDLVATAPGTDIHI